MPLQVVLQQLELATLKLVQVQLLVKELQLEQAQVQQLAKVQDLVWQRVLALSEAIPEQQVLPPFFQVIYSTSKHSCFNFVTFFEKFILGLLFVPNLSSRTFDGFLHPTFFSLQHSQMLGHIFHLNLRSEATSRIKSLSKSTKNKKIE